MRFLVTSVTAALAGMGLDVHLVIHPVLEDGPGAKVSIMHIELDGDMEAERSGAPRRPANLARVYFGVGVGLGLLT